MTQCGLQEMSDVNDKKEGARKPTREASVTNQWDTTVKAILAKARSCSKVFYRRIKKAIIVPPHPPHVSLPSRAIQRVLQTQRHADPNFFRGVPQHVVPPPPPPRWTSSGP